MNLIDDPLDALLDELVSDAGTIAASIDPVRIRTSAPDMKPRRISVWTGVVFAAAVAALLAIALGAGFVHQKSITPVTRSKKPFGTPATVSPFVLTPDPDDPGWACKEGTGESGSGGQMEMIQTIVCMSTTVPKRGEGPFAEGLSNTQIAQDPQFGLMRRIEEHRRPRPLRSRNRTFRGSGLRTPKTRVGRAGYGRLKPDL